MAINIRCVHCGDFFIHAPGEAKKFLEMLRTSNRPLLQEQIPFVPKAQAIYTDYFKWVLAFLEAHCPYCRTVLFDSYDAFVTKTKRELREAGISFSIENIPGAEESHWRLAPGQNREHGPVKTIFPTDEEKTP